MSKPKFQNDSDLLSYFHSMYNPKCQDDSGSLIPEKSNSTSASTSVENTTCTFRRIAEILCVILIATICSILLFLTITYYSSSSLEQIDILTINSSSFEQIKSLPIVQADQADHNNIIDCLTSVGVDRKNVIPRGSGSAYTEINWQWNTLNGYMEPLVYLVAHSVSDVQKAVICSRFCNVRIVPRSGGHSYVKNGFGDADSLIVDLSKLNHISTNPTQMTCEIGTGARNGLIHYTLWKQGDFVIPAGICPTVGIGGLAQGGGYGYFSRLFGLTADNVIEMEMVDANGRLLTINNSTNTDLFWALRGGGGGSFGIVTKFKFNMYRKPVSIVFGYYQFSVKDFPQFFYAWQSFITSSIPNNVGTFLIISKQLISMEFFIINSENVSRNATVNDVKFLIQKFGFPTAVNSSVQLLSYYEFILNREQYYFNEVLSTFAQLANMTRDIHTGWKKVKSFYVDKIIDKSRILKLHSQLEVFLEGSDLLLEHYGGAINNLSPSQTAFVHRGKTMYDVQLRTYNPDGKESMKATAAMIKFYEQSKTIFNHKESYQNYLDEDIYDNLKRHYGNNLDKLIEVKKRVDPRNVFRHPQSIPVWSGASL